MIALLRIIHEINCSEEPVYTRNQGFADRELIRRTTLPPWLSLLCMVVYMGALRAAKNQAQAEAPRALMIIGCDAVPTSQWASAEQVDPAHLAVGVSPLDYSELARGTQVQVNLYGDRLEFLSPGGLYGTVTADTVAQAGYSSTRNQYLADILESTPYEGGFVAENRGTGFRLMGLELERSRMEAPVIRDSVAMFSLEFRRRQDRPSIDSACEEIAAFAAENEPCSASEISDAPNIPRSTVTIGNRPHHEAVRFGVAQWNRYDSSSPCPDLFP